VSFKTNIQGTIMAQETPFEALNKNAELAVDKTMRQATAQARGAMDGYFDFLQKAVSSFPSDGTPFGGKIKIFTEQNIATAKSFVDAMSQARDFQDVIRIQTEYMQTQFSTYVAQAQSLSEAFTKSMTDEVKMPFKRI
jgi:Phasin protein